MPPSIATPERSARLNPFAFPSDTTARFFLLIVFVISADVFYWHGIADQLGGGIRDLDACLQGRPIFGSDILNEAKVEPVRLCMESLAAIELPWLAAGLTVLVIVALAIFWNYPLWLRRKLGLRSLPENDLPELATALAELSLLAGLRTAPQFLWSPLDASPRALAYGCGGPFRVALSGGVAGLFFSRPDRFRALMLHELAHIRNGDVTKTYLTVAVWWSFVVTALIPYLLVEVSLQHQWRNLLDVSFRAVAFTAIVLITRNSVLRARELYADVRASSWAGGRPGLAGALTALRPIPILIRPLSVHPDPALRRHLLENTDSLFRVGIWDALGIGLAAAIAGVALLFLLAVAVFALGPTAISMSTSTKIAITIVPSLIVVPLAAVAASAMIWRGTFLSVIRGDRSRLIVRTALPLAAGATFGLPIFLGYPILDALSGGETKRFIAGSSIALSTLLLGALVVIVLTVLLLSLGFAIYLSWIHAGVRAWLPVALLWHRPDAVWKIGLGVAGVLAVPWFSGLPLLLVASVAHASQLEPPITGVTGIAALSIAAFQFFPFNLFAWIGLPAVWAYPMAAALWRTRQEGTVADWAYLDPEPPGIVVSPLRCRRALLIGVGGALAGILAFRFVSFDVQPAVLHQAQLPDSPSAAPLVSMLLIAVLAQVATSVAAALATRQLGFVHGMFAAFVAGCGLVPAECVRLLTWTPDLKLEFLLFFTAVPTLIGGAIAAMPAAALGALLVDRQPYRAVRAP